MTAEGTKGITAAPSPQIDVVVEYGHVAQIRTTNPGDQTSTGFGPGQTGWEEARAALCPGASITQEVASGLEIRCPLAGLVIEVSGQMISAMTVMPPEQLRKASFLKGPRDTRPITSRTPRADAVQKVACERSTRVRFAGGEMRQPYGLVLYFGVVYTGPSSYEPESIDGAYTVTLDYGNAPAAITRRIVTVNAVRQFAVSYPMCSAARRQECIESGATRYSAPFIDLKAVHCRLRTQ
jgi:hypothetical protein